jgi:hypothetical protein
MSCILFAHHRQGMCTEDDIKPEDAQSKRLFPNAVLGISPGG